MKESRRKYLQFLNPLELLQTKKVLKNNPTIISEKVNTTESIISLYQYDSEHFDCKQSLKTQEKQKT